MSSAGAKGTWELLTGAITVKSSAPVSLAGSWERLKVAMFHSAIHAAAPLRLLDRSGGGKADVS